jgi:hypothetical protein
MITKPTFESITAGLSKMLEQLKTYNADQTAKAAGHRRAAEALHQRADAADAEGARAALTATKLAELLG